MRKRKIVQMTAILLGALFAVSCGNPTNSSSSSNSGGNDSSSSPVQGEADIWSASTAETVLLDKPVSTYENVRQDAAINISMAKNEYEGAQFFLTALERISSYDIRVDDLKMADGTVFSADNINIYNYKYVQVTNNVASHRKFGTGYYPDAILPFEAAKKFGENYVEKGTNQGVYVRFYVPSDAKAGVYTGNVVVTYDGQTETIPVSLNVWDVTISEENHLHTAFLHGWFWQNPELNCTEEKYYDYVELLSEYRLSPYFLMTKDTRDVAQADYWDRYAETVYNYVKQPINSTYCFNYLEAGSTFNTTEFEKMLLKLTEKSCETKLNVMTKGFAHFNSLIDEATMQNKLDQTIQVTNDFRAVRISAAKKVRDNKATYIEKYGVDEAYVEELATTIEKIPHLFVSNYDEDYAPYIEDDGTDTGVWCPNVWEFQDEQNVKKYIDDLQIDWWYGCGGSSRSIPSLQTDDYTLSPRIMSWQQMYYGITGNLFWGIDMNGVGTDTGWEEVEDWYDRHAATAGGVNGDGQLTYPGAHYELDMPVATRRLEAVRDGMEEYEMLYEMKQNYYTITGSDAAFDNVYAFLTRDLFSEINIIATADNFDYSRNLMAQLLMLSKSDAGFCIKDIALTSTNMSGTIFVKDGYSLSANGTAMQGRAVTGGMEYDFNFALENYSNEFSIKVEGLASNNTLMLKKAGKAVASTPSEEMRAAFANEFTTVEATLETAMAGALGDKVIKLNVAETVGTLQSIKFAPADILSIGEHVSDVKFLFYNGSGKTQQVAISAKFAGDAVISQLASAELVEGWNEITISGLNQKNWAALKSISYLRIAFGKTTTESAVDNIYFGGYYITYLKGGK